MTRRPRSAKRLTAYVAEARETLTEATSDGREAFNLIGPPIS